MNALFINGELVHGQRYIVCIHANATTIQYEDWTLNLEAISTCSDGVTVDLTPPTAGRVWIGTNPTVIYQVLADPFFLFHSHPKLQYYMYSLFSMISYTYYIYLTGR